MEVLSCGYSLTWHTIFLLKQRLTPKSLSNFDWLALPISINLTIFRVEFSAHVLKTRERVAGNRARSAAHKSRSAESTSVIGHLDDNDRAREYIIGLPPAPCARHAFGARGSRGAWYAGFRCPPTLWRTRAWICRRSIHLHISGNHRSPGLIQISRDRFLAEVWGAFVRGWLGKWSWDWRVITLAWA